QRGGAAFENLESDRRPGAAGTYQKGALARDLESFLQHAIEMSNAINIVAFPAAVRQPPKYVGRADESGAIRGDVAIAEGGKFMRHGDDDAVEIAHQPHRSHEGRQVLRRHMGWNDHRV